MKFKEALLTAALLVANPAVAEETPTPATTVEDATVEISHLLAAAVRIAQEDNLDASFYRAAALSVAMYDPSIDFVDCATATPGLLEENAAALMQGCEEGIGIREALAAKQVDAQAAEEAPTREDTLDLSQVADQLLD